MTRPISNVPPFPRLEWGGYAWTAEVVLSSWAGFQCRRGPYATVSSDAPSEGNVTLRVLSADDEEPMPPSVEQAAAFRHLLDHGEAVTGSVLKALLLAYPRLRDTYGYEDEEAAEIMPEVDTDEQFRHLIGLSTVHVHTVSKDAEAYVGLEFGCSWDGEHGLGMMVHKDRVVEIGGADTAILEWIAEDDAAA